MGDPTPPASAGKERVKIESDHLAAIVRSSDDAILSKDRDAIITSWNDGAERLYGYTAAEVVGKSVAIIIPPERAGEEKEIIRRILAGERVEHYEAPRVRKDGTRVVVSLTASPIHGAGGEIVGVATQARDISSTIRALEEAERRFERAFRDAPIGMFTVALDPGNSHTIRQPNAELTHLFGYSEQELAGMSLEDLTHPDDAVRERELLGELAAGRRRSYVIEKRSRHKDGRWIWVWTTVSQMEGTESDPCALVHVLDVTERRRVEDELERTRTNLERSNAELDQFAYVASHDLKEPLILVSAYARMLDERHRDDLDEEARTFLSHVREEAGRMKAMIDDLLDYSRLETRAEDPVTVQLDEALDLALRTLAPRIDESGGEVAVERPLPAVQGSPSQFERLFRNLVSNAIKFRSEEPPRVRIGSERTEDGWLVSVADNGIGVDPTKSDTVFEIFQRLGGNERYGGTGMGLAICKRIVERHGGRIWVEPGETRGSVFKFSLPG